MFAQSTRYALSAMVVLGRRHPELTSAGELAVALDLPGNYLSKVLNQLRAEGFLEGSRGRGGGFRLRRQAGSIPLIDVVECFEPLDDTRRCLLGKGTCREVGGCPAHAAWKEATAPLMRFLETHTLADLAAEAVPWPPTKGEVHA